jgi:hypothetical protein
VKAHPLEAILTAVRSAMEEIVDDLDATYGFTASDLDLGLGDDAVANTVGRVMNGPRVQAIVDEVYELVGECEAMPGFLPPIPGWPEGSGGNRE